MKKKIKTLCLIGGASVSYHALMMLLYLLVLPLLPRSLMSDDGIRDTFCTVMLLAVYSLWYWRLTKKRDPHIYPSANNKKNTAIWKIAASVFVIGAGMFSLSNLWMTLVEKVLVKIPFIHSSFQAFQKAFSGTSSGNTLFALLSLVVIGPIVEELLFRGILFHYFERLSKKPWVPICGTALIFGIWHGIFVQCVYTAICGLIMAIVYYQTRNLTCVMAIHMMNNLMSFLSDLPQLAGVRIGIDIIGYIAIIAMIALLFKLHHPDGSKQLQCNRL